MHSLENFIRKKDGYDNFLGEIGKRESENEVVWITLQARKFEWKKVTIPKLKEYETDLVSIFYADPKHRENFFKLETGQVEDKTKTYIPIVFMPPAILGPIFCGEEKTSWGLHGIVKS